MTVSYTHLKVAVVTEDNGAEVEGQKVNLGENLIDGLKNNKNLDWQFVSNKQEDVYKRQD